jgi:TIGR03009 family protein
MRETPRLAQTPRARVVGGPPEGYPLSPEQQQRVDAILRFWEFHTSQIKTFQCKFTRQTFNFVFGPQDAPFTVDRGSLRYAAPDKGLMRVDEVFAYNPQASGEADRYQKQDVQFGEYWVCDGESIYQFDSRTKTLTETKLPPEMRGQSIGDGPLPFLFGAKAETMKSRYWIREITPSGNTGVEYWLEAIPKRAEDAANFDKLLVQLEKPKTRGEQLVPKAMKAFKKEGHVIYTFNEHMANDPRHRVAGFFRSFVRPSTPLGWKKVVEDWSQPPVEASVPNADRPTDPRLGDANTTPPANR